ncbi:CHAT domain-containing protein [bacterium]|nr:CHAT domain-containing protein [bacterium]
MYRVFIRLIIIFCGLGLVGAGAQSLEGMRQITTHPSDDFQPAVSPDGRWLAFVSNRSGNADIWIKALPRGHALQVTEHHSADTQPVWRPNSKGLVFVSTRRDARGDLWRIDIDKNTGRVKGKARQLTSYLGVDRDPVYSPDRAWIAYTSDRSGYKELWIRERGTGSMHALNIRGSMPAVSPDGRWMSFVNEHGALALTSLIDRSITVIDSVSAVILDGYSCWTIDSASLIFMRINHDSDGDGLITPADYGALWHVAVDSIGFTAPPMKISVGLENEDFPCRLDSTHFVFSRDEAGRRDLWTLPVDGLFPRMRNAAEQYRLVLDKSLGWITQQGLEQALLGYSRVEEYFPDDTHWTARAMFQMAELNRLMGRMSLAESLFDSLATDMDIANVTRKQAKIKIAALPDKSRAIRLEICDSLIQDGVYGRQAAETWMIKGDLYGEAENWNTALGAYETALKEVSSGSNIWAQIHVNMGDAWHHLQMSEEAAAHYIIVLNRMGHSAFWRERAGRKLWNMAPKDAATRIIRIHDLAARADASVIVHALAGLETAAVLERDGRLEQAERELRHMTQDTVLPDWAQLEAALNRARILADLDQETEAIRLLDAMAGSSQGIADDPSTYRANSLLYNLLSQSGRRLMAHSDFALAESRLSRAVILRPDQMDIRRLWIEAAFNAGHIETVIDRLSTALQLKPEDPILLYSLGLAYSYAGERDVGILQTSNEYLERSLISDYRMIHPYRTLSFNYEALERLAESEASKRPGVLIRVGRTIMGPLTWLWGLMPWTHDDTPPAYYELAIDALITAIALNDEEADPVMEAALAQNLANNFYNLGEFGYSKAFYYYQLKLKLDPNFVNPLQEARIYEQAGRCGMYLEETDAADEYLNRAVEIYTDLGHSGPALQNRRRRAFLYHLTGNYEEAIEAYQQLLAEDEAALRWDDVALGLRNIAFNYHLLGEPEDVLIYAGRAAAILERKDIPLKPSPTSKLRIEIFGWSIPVWGMEEIGGASSAGFTEADEAALVYALISQSAEALKDFPKALQFEERRLHIAVGRKDGLAQRISLNRIGRLYFDQRYFERAWHAFAGVYKASCKKKDAQGQATSIFNLGETALALLYNQNIYARADSVIEIAEVDLAKLSAGIDQDDYRLLLHHMLGRIRSAMAHASADGQSVRESINLEWRRLDLFDKAETHFQISLELSRKNGDRKLVAKILLALSEIASLTGSYEAAEKYLDQCRPLYSATGNSEQLWRLALVEARLSDRRNSTNTVEKYEHALELLRVTPVIPARAEERLADMQARRDIYIEAACVIAERGDAEESLNLAEGGRQQWAADMIARHPPVWRRERHKILWGNLIYARNRLRELTESIRLASADRVGYKEIVALENESVRYAEEINDLKDDILQEDDVLAFLTASSSFNLKSFQQTLAPGDGALSWMVGRSQTLLWNIDAEDIHVHIIPLGRSSWQRVIEQLESGVHQAQHAVSDSLLQWLDDKLTQPVSSWMAEREHIIICADDALWRIPFSALGRRDDVWLDRLTITLTGSLAEYALAFDRRKIPGNRVFAAGDVSDRWMGGLAEYRSAFGPGHATESFVRSQMADVDRIYFGRWRRPSPADPLTAAIMLFPDSDNDGVLKTGDLFQHELSASLVLFPAEKPGHTRGWESILALQRTLLYADVPTITVPLWSVPPEVKKLWTETFHEALKILPIDEAMVEAQTIIRQKYPQKMYWSGFTVWGYGGLHPEKITGFAQQNLAAKVRRGRAYEREGGIVQALRQYDVALSMARVLKDSTLMQRINREKLRAAVTGKRWRQAAVIQSVLQTWTCPAPAYNALQKGKKNLLAFYQRGGQYSEAASVQESFVKQSGDSAAAGEYEKLAMLWGQASNWDKAFANLDIAFAIYQSSSDSLSLGRVSLRKGRLALEAERFYTAYTSLSYGISQFKILDIQGSSTSEYELAAGLQLWGLAAEKLTRYEEAREYQTEALKIFSLGQHALQAGQGYQYLANLDWKEGRYREALLNQHKALSIFDSLQAPKQQSMGNTTLGLIHHGLGDIDKARLYMSKALKIAVETGELADQAAIRKNMGRVSLKERDLTSAEAHFRESARLDSLTQSRRGMAYDQRHLGRLDRLRGDFASAQLRLDRGLMLSRQVGDVRNMAQCYLALGEIPGTEALAALDSGLVVTTNLDMPEIRWRLFRQRARFHREAGSVDLALRDYYSAIGIIEDMRKTLGAESFKQGFLDSKMDIYEELVSHLSNNGYKAEALAFVERSKSRNLIDMLANTDIDIGSGNEPGVIKLREAEDDVKVAQSRLSEWTGRASALTADQQAEKSHWEHQLSLRRERVLEARTALEASSPELASLISVSPLMPEEMQGVLPDSTLMLVYHVGPEITRIWAVSRDDIIYASSACTDTELSKTIASFREQIDLRLSSDSEATVLWQWLAAPVENILKNAAHVIVVPHGILHYCPFSALMDGSGRRWIERQSISLVPSATVLRFCLDKGAAVASWCDSASVLAFSNPLTEHDDLPFADKEVAALQRSFAKTDSVSGSAVTETAVRELVGDYSIIHFACHGEYTADSPLFSALFLTPDEVDDGRLEAHEIFDLHMQCQLATLSACETGLSEVTRGDEIIGLARAFIYAGAPALVCSLWKVDDLATAVLMKRFYRALALGVSRAEALRRAQLAVMKNIGKDPALWAAFSITGDFR